MKQRRTTACRRMLRAATLVLLLVTALIAATGAHAATNTMFGFNSWVYAPNVALQQTVGTPVRRMFVYWNEVEPAPGQWNWATFDQNFNELIGAGLKPEITLMGSPCWSRPSVPCNDAGYTGPPDRQYETYWSRFATLAAQRYNRAVGFEIWSEPNLIWFFYPGIDPARYSRLLGEAYRAIKSVNHSMPVASAGLAAADTEYGAELSYQSFIAGMYKAGAGSTMDALAIHIYPTATLSDGTIVWNPVQFEQILSQIRAVRTQYRGKQPIWVTEAGESTGTELGAPVADTPAQHAADLMTMVNEAKADSDVTMMLIHTVQDTADTPGDPFNGVDQGWGAFSATGAPKPLACALSAAFGGSLRCATTPAGVGPVAGKGPVSQPALPVVAVQPRSSVRTSSWVRKRTRRHRTHRI